MAHVIQHRLPESPFAQRSCHTVYVGRHLFSGTGVARFVIYFYGYDTVIPGIRLTGIRIDMPRQLLQIIGLSLTCPAVFMYPAFWKTIRESPGVRILLRITVSEIGLGCKYYIYTPAFEPPYQVVEQV